MSATASSHAERRRAAPLAEAPAAGAKLSDSAPDGLLADPAGLLIICGLATLAGAVDASAIWQTKDIFVSFMSGNTTMLGVALAHGESHRLGTIGEVIATFVAGAAVGTIIRFFAGGRHLSAVVLAVAAVLVAPAMLPAWRIAGLAMAMGMLNSAAHAAGPVQVNLTYVTGALVKLGQGLGGLLCGHAKDWRWLVQAVPWVGMLAGAIAATWALGVFAVDTFAALPVVALLLAGLTWRTGPRRPV